MNKIRRDKLLRLTCKYALVLCLFFAPIFTAAQNEPKHTAVIYPKVRAPYNKIYLSIYQGVKQANSGRSFQYEIDKKDSVDRLDRWINRNNIGNVVALGGSVVKAVSQIEVPRNSVVSGAMFHTPETIKQYQGVSMAPNPGLLFDRLLSVSPNIKQVYVVYEQSKDAWLIERAEVIAKDKNIELIGVGAKNIKELATLYRKTIHRIDNKKQAIWIPNSGKGLEKALMFKLLEDAWKRKIIIFSSNFSDVKKGVLFSLFPDNEAMGAQLFRLLEKVSSNTQEDEVNFSNALHGAINIRTAEHLGFKLTGEQLKAYKFIYPTPK